MSMVQPRLPCLRAFGNVCRSSVHTGTHELLTAHAYSCDPVQILPNSVVELPSLVGKTKCIQAPWRDVIDIWKQYRSIDSLQVQKIYGTVQNQLIFWPSYSSGSTYEETVLSYFAAHLRQREILPFWQDAIEYIVTPGAVQSVMRPVTTVKPQLPFSIHAWGHPVADAYVPAAQDVTVYTHTWLEPEVDSIQMPWSQVKSCMERVAAYSDEECEEAFPLNDEDLSVITHYCEQGDELGKERLDEGKEVLCEWHAIRCRRYDWPFRIDILGRPHVLRFKM